MSIHKVIESRLRVPAYGDINLGAVKLESGRKLENITLRFEQVGDPDSPVILVCHALTGHHRTVGKMDADGWWRGLIGPERFIDTNRYRVITFNALGGCHGSTGPISINPKTKKPYQSDFPFFTIRDMAMVQALALSEFGIHHALAVIGGSLGGLQALEIGILYPSLIKKVICLAATPTLSDYGIAFNAVGRKAIIDDPDWQGGRYTEECFPKAGLSTARMLAMLTYRSKNLFNGQFKREDKNGWGLSHDENAFQVESYLQYQGQKLAGRFDPNSYLYLLKAMDSHDIGRGRGGVQKALEMLQADLLGVGFRGDLIYPPESISQMVDLHKQLHPRSKFFEVDTLYGHDGFLVEFDKWGDKIREWLNT